MDRSRMYKNRVKDSDELRRRRKDQSMELRKAKKEEKLMKIRNIDVNEPLSPRDSNTPNKSLSFSDCKEIVENMKSSNLKVKKKAFEQCRRCLSRQDQPPISDFVKAGAVDLLIKNLDGPDDIVFECAWALTNVASSISEHTKLVANSEALPKFIKLLGHPSENVAEQCVWALGNIAGDGPVFRDKVIEYGTIEPTIAFLERIYDKSKMVQNAAWMLSNLCRHKNPSPPLTTVQKLLPVFAKLLVYPDQSVRDDSAWAIAYACDDAHGYLDEVLASDCILPLLELIKSEQCSSISPALRAFGNIVIGDAKQTQSVLDIGLLDFLPPLLRHKKSSVAKETCWLLSNVTAGTSNQIASVINHNLIPICIDLMNTAEFRVQKEACWVISNIVHGGTDAHILYLLSCSVLEALSNILDVSDPKCIQNVIDTLMKIFSTTKDTENFEKCCLAFENCGGLDKIEALQDHAENSIYQSAADFLGTFFATGVDEDDVEESSDGFNFVTPSANQDFTF